MGGGLSTVYPQLINTLSAASPWLAIALSIGVGLYTSFKFRRDFVSKRDLDQLRAAVSEFSGDIADLTDRFSRFQKREGMRNARESKESAKSIMEEAQALVNGAQAPEPAGKIALYAKRKMQ